VIFKPATETPVVSLRFAEVISEAGLPAGVLGTEMGGKSATVVLANADDDVHQPFGGFLDSGSAFREQGLEALRFYTRVKTVAVKSA
jgi:acyl-CoA reductase-like NAD-dependent aldehyde dehydrogenase